MHSPGEFHVDAMLCDSVVAAEGKLYVQGAGWDTLSAPGFPFQAPRIGLAIILSVPYTATNQPHKLTISLWESDTQISLGPLEAGVGPAAVPTPRSFEIPLTAGRPPHLSAGDSQPAPIAINLDGFIFERAGNYSFRITLGDDELGALPFRLLSPPPQAFLR